MIHRSPHRQAVWSRVELLPSSGTSIAASSKSRCSACSTLSVTASEVGLPEKNRFAGRLARPAPASPHEFQTGPAKSPRAPAGLTWTNPADVTLAVRPASHPAVATMVGMTRRFRRALAMMRSRDPQRQEDGFGELVPHAAEHLNELIEAFTYEPEHGLRCWLLELIGEAQSPAALPVLAGQLHSADSSLRYWAVTGLTMLNTKEARTLLWKARSSGLIE